MGRASAKTESHASSSKSQIIRAPPTNVWRVVYEGRSICNENSPVYPKV